MIAGLKYLAGPVSVFWQQAAMRQAQFSAAYEALDGTRTRKKRNNVTGPEDHQLDTTALHSLRNIHRDYDRNHPIIEALFTMEVDEIIGEGPIIQAKTEDSEWNIRAEALWKEQMCDQPCDRSGRFTFPEFLGLQFLSYRRDGDVFTLFGKDRLEAVEGDLVGTPYGGSTLEHSTVVNGIAFSKTTGRRVGYYVGRPHESGYYIDPSSYRKVKAEKVHHMAMVRRFSQSRGRPCLTSSIKYIDALEQYVDAEQVAAVVNACFAAYIIRKDAANDPTKYTGGVHPTGLDDDGHYIEKMRPGIVERLQPGEDIKGVGMERPGTHFEPYVTRMLSMIGRPMCIPLMLIMLDFSGATFMNARIAYQQAQKHWKRQQAWIIRPYVSRVWKWFVERMMADGKLDQKPDALAHKVQLNRWPYVDPYKEAMANKTELANKTTTRRQILAAKGVDYDDHKEQVDKEKEDFPQELPNAKPKNSQ